MAVADAYTSRQSWLPQGHLTPPNGLTEVCPISAADPSAPRHTLPSRIIPPPTPIPSVRQTIVLRPRPAPCHISPTAAAFAAFSRIPPRSGSPYQAVAGGIPS